MKGLVNGIKIICILMLPLMMYVLIVRLNNGNETYLHMNDLLTKLSELDFYTPIENTINYFTDTIATNFTDIPQAFGQVHDIGSFFGAIGQVLELLFFILWTPIDLVYNIIQFVVTWVGNFFKLMDFIINY